MTRILTGPGALEDRGIELTVSFGRRGYLIWQSARGAPPPYEKLKRR